MLIQSVPEAWHRNFPYEKTFLLDEPLSEQVKIINPQD